MSHFSKVAAEVASELSNGHVAAAADKDADWQRVNSYIADVLKDSHVLYAKLARLQGDFAGEELDRLVKVSEAVLRIGDELSGFSKAFFEGKYDMSESEFTYGAPSAGGGAPGEAGPAGAPPSASVDDLTAGLGAPPPEAAAHPPAPEAAPPAPEAAPPQDFDVEVEEAGGDEDDESDYSGDEDESEEKKKKPAKEE